MNCINGEKCFFDTNILAYCFDSRDKKKQKIAKKLFSDCADNGSFNISTQILIELFNVLTRKLKYHKETALEIIENFAQLPVYQVKTDDIEDAIKASIEAQWSIFDALVMVSAKNCGCATVFTEDLNCGQVFDGVQIVNPFAKQC